MENVLIYGAGAIGKIAYSVFLRSSYFNVVGFTADSSYVSSDSFMGLPLIPFEKVLDHYPPESYKMFVAVGYRRMKVREVMYNKALELGYELVNCIDSSVLILNDVSLGNNNLILPGVIIEPGAIIGNNNIIWTHATICHDTKIGSHNFIAAGVIVGGFCEIGNLNFIGFGSILRDSIRVPDNVLIGASSYVNKDLQPMSMYYGVPVRKIKDLEYGVEVL